MSSTRLALAAASVLVLASLSAAQTNGGFETGTLANWIDQSAGAAQVVAAPNNGFPSEGSHHLVLSAGLSDAAIAGLGPHQGGGGPGNVSKVSHEFARPAGLTCAVSIDWTFLNAEGPNSSFNDFLSISIVDVATGALITDLVFIDTGANEGAPFYRNVPGAGDGTLSQVHRGGGIHETLPTGFKRAWRGLPTTVLPGQMLRLEIAVGNGGDDGIDSVALIDNFVVRAGQRQNGQVVMRVLGSAAVSSASTGPLAEWGPYEFRVKPGQQIAIRAATSVNGMPWALIGGDVRLQGFNFGFGSLDIFIAGAFLVFDGIHPQNASDLFLGTLNATAVHYPGAVPTSAVPGEVALQGIFVDATNPFGYGLTSATNLVVAGAVHMPVATTDVLNGAAFLGDDDGAAVDLTAMNGGAGFSFYGTSHTQVFVNANGNLTFGAADPAAEESLAAMKAGLPRIAPLWDDLDALGLAGSVAADVTAQVARFTWRVAEKNDSARSNHFTAELWADGKICFHYECTSVSDGLVGISPGNTLLDADLPFGSSVNGNKVLSTAAEARDWAYATLGPAGANGLEVMSFSLPRLSFVPTPSGGYASFAGSR